MEVKVKNVEAKNGYELLDKLIEELPEETVKELLSYAYSMQEIKYTEEECLDEIQLLWGGDIYAAALEDAEGLNDLARNYLSDLAGYDALLDRKQELVNYPA